jgi:hypothetical protein
MANRTPLSHHRSLKRPRRPQHQAASKRVAAAVSVIVIQLRRDDFIDIKPVLYPVNGLANLSENESVSERDFKPLLHVPRGE